MAKRWFNQSKLMEFVYGELSYKYTTGDEMICDCCFCGHEATLWVNKETAQFTCYRCLEGGSAYGIIEHVKSVERKQARIILGVEAGEFIQPADAFKEIFAGLSQKFSALPAVQESNQVVPENTQFFGWGKPVYKVEEEMVISMIQALAKRGFDYQQIVENRAGWGFGGRWDQRVVLPVYFRNELVWWQAWDYTKTQPIKYNNPRNDEVKISRKALVYNLEKHKDAKALCVTEGCFNSWACDQVGMSGVATFGKGVTPVQIFQIVTHPSERIYIGLDTDARDKAVDLYHGVRAFGKEALLCTLPVAASGKKIDWNDLTPEDRRQVIAKAGEPDWFWDS
jgi:hypothetical protein